MLIISLHKDNHKQKYILSNLILKINIQQQVYTINIQLVKMVQLRCLILRKEILLILFKIKVKLLFHISFGDHKITILKPEIFLPLLMLKDKFKIGILIQANCYQLSKMIQVLLINNSIVWIIIMMELNQLLLVANLLLESMIKLKDKKLFNSKNLMLLIIVIPIESIVLNLIEILKVNIWFILEDGIRL